MILNQFLDIINREEGEYLHTYTDWRGIIVTLHYSGGGSDVLGKLMNNKKEYFIQSAGICSSHALILSFIGYCFTRSGNRGKKTEKTLHTLRERGKTSEKWIEHCRSNSHLFLLPQKREMLLDWRSMGTVNHFPDRLPSLVCNFKHFFCLFRRMKFSLTQSLFCGDG